MTYILCQECQQVKELYAKDMCKPCYQKKHRPPRRIIVCVGCGHKKPHHARGMCDACYMVWYRAQQTKEV